MRVPDSVGYSKAIGLDIETWLGQDLVDLLTGSCYFQLEPWENFAELGKRFDVPVYAVLSASRFVDPDNGRIKLPPEDWYGEALNAWEAGVSGIYIFNVFDPHDQRFRELGDPELLRAKNPQTRFISGSRWRPEYWLKGGSAFCQWPDAL